MDVAERFWFGKQDDLKELPRFPRRTPVISCDEWRRRLGAGQASPALIVGAIDDAGFMATPMYSLPVRPASTRVSFGP